MSAETMRTLGVTVAVFLALFITVRHLHPAGILFYQGIALGLCMSGMQFLIDRKRRILVVGEAAKNALLSFLLIYCFVFTVPTTVDRAYSVKMLARLGESPEGLTRDEVGRFFVNSFLAEGGVDKRLIEQSATGSITEKGGRYSLTPVGRFLEASFHLTQIVFACEETR